MTDQAEEEGQFANVVDWVEQWLAPNLERRVDRKGTSQGAAWCASWWAHTEARRRITGLWREWEVAFATDAFTDWWGVFDEHWKAITASDGPFGRCRGGEHSRHPPLDLNTVPDDVLQELIEET